MKSILYCIADQDRVRLFMIRGTLPGIVYTLGLQARTRVTRLIFVPRVPSKEKNVQFLSMISDFVPLFFFANMITVEDQFVSEYFVCDVDKEGMVFFYEIWNKIYQAVEFENSLLKVRK